MSPARSEPIPVVVPPESENYAAFGHTLRVVVLPELSGPLVTIRVFCTDCGLRFQGEGVRRPCEPMIPPGRKP